MAFPGVMGSHRERVLMIPGANPPKLVPEIITCRTLASLQDQRGE